MRVYIASYLIKEEEYALETDTPDEPTKEEITKAIQNLEDSLPEGAIWQHPPKEDNYFLK